MKKPENGEEWHDELYDRIEKIDDQIRQRRNFRPWLSNPTLSASHINLRVPSGTTAASTSASGILNRHRWLSSRLSRRDVKDIRRIMKASPSPISQIIGCFALVRCVSRIDLRVAAPHKLLRPYYISRSIGSRERHSLSGQRG